MSIKIFNKIPVEQPRYNGFNLSHSKVLSFDMGELIPIFVTDVVPGDRFNAAHETFVRFSPLLTPVMHMFNVYVHSFFVPNRLLWTTSDDDDDTHFGWEAFITGGEDGDLDPTFPMYNYNFTAQSAAGTISDYLGIPSFTYTSQAMPINVLPLRAYKMIWNEYYRNQNVQDPYNVNKSHTATINDVKPDENSYAPLKVNNERDYLTSALPWLQRGSEVNLPVEGEIAFVPDYKAAAETYPTTSGDITGNSGALQLNSAPGTIYNLENKTYDLENVTITVNELRNAQALQRWLEANARGGARYKEQILSLFGVITSDSRLDRPEYLGGGKSPMVISEVLATADTENTDNDTAVGDMAGHGVSVGKSNKWSRRFEEHGFVMTLMFVRPKPAYYNGLPRMYWKSDRYDYFFPHFENIGEQEIYNGEVFYDGSGTLDPDGTFGYAPRYAEYKHINDSVHGEFRDSLDYWHLARKLDNTVALNSSFVECNPDDRIFAVTTYDNIYAQVYNEIYASRPMQQYGIPKLR